MKKEVNKAGKNFVIISALILTLIICLAFVSAVEAVTVTNPDLDAASLSFSLFKKKNTTSITGNAIDESGNTIATVTVKANEEVGKVKEDFYGVGTYMNFFSEDGTTQSCTNKPVNYTWNRQMFLDSGMKILRIRAYLNYLYSNDTLPFDIKVANETQLKNIGDTIKWGHEEDIKILVSIVNMPEFLQNRTSGYCNDSQWKSCPPNNLSASNDMIIHLLNNITNYGQYKNVILEVGNEPYISSLSGAPHYDYGWCNNLSYDNITKGIEYVKWFNSTYSTLKLNSNLSFVKVIGPAGFRYAPVMTLTFLSNITRKMDGISIHPYGYNSNSQLEQYKDTKNLLVLCSTYGANCSEIYLSEWNVGTNFQRGSLSEIDPLLSIYADSFSSILNSYPSNVSMILWHWSADKEFVGLYDMVVQPECSFKYLRFSPSYNVTKDFAHYHAGGNMIVNSSSNDNSVKSVASLNPQGIWHITVINTATNNINVNIDVSSTGVEAIKDLATDTIYPVSNGIANIGILTKYDIKHYEGIADYEPPIIEEKKSSTTSSSSTSNKVVSINEINNLSNHEIVSLKSDTNIVVSTNEILNNIEGDSSKFSEEDKVYGPVDSEETLSTEESESEIQGNSYTGALSFAVSNKSYLTIAIILLGSIICTVIIISILYRKKKRESDKVKKLMDWVDKARTLGYTPEKMKEMLAEYNWDKDLVEKVVGK